MESQIEKAFDIPCEECIRVSWILFKLIFIFTCLSFSKCTRSFFFYRFQQNMAPMLKRFYRQLWIEFHRKWVYCFSSLEPCLVHNSESVLFFSPCSLRPEASTDDPFKALVFDSNFDHYRGVVANIAVFGGRVRKGDRIMSAHLRKTYEVNELGLLRPDEHPTQTLYVTSFDLSSQ